MGFKFRKSIKIAPGVKVNFNKKSTGVTFGGKGVNYTINSKGKRTKSIGIPGTGLYYTTTNGKNNKRSKTTKAETYETQTYSKNKEYKTMSAKKWYQKSWFIILMLICFFPVGIYLMWKHSNWNKVIKLIITALFVFIFLDSLLSEDAELTPNLENNHTTTTLAAIIDESKAQSSTEKQTTIKKETTTKEQTTTQKPTTKEETTTQAPTTKEQTTTQTPTTTEEQTTTQTPTTTEEQTTTQEQTMISENETSMVWIPQSGKRYHSYASCSGMIDPSYVTLEEAINWGYTPCQRCH